jgi:hypothetical protein
MSEELFLVRLYMKSGNVIVLTDVIEANWEEKFGRKTVAITQNRPLKDRETLMVPTLCLEQIEAVTYEIMPTKERTTNE